VSAVTDDRIITDHLARYNYAANFIGSQFNGCDRLFGADIFCGSGYGSNILARVTNSLVLGLDASDESIAQANSSFQRPNILFSAKIFPFSLPLNSFDYICSFESLEHVLDYMLFADELAGSIKRSGLLLISCPNADKIDLELNPYHWHYKHLAPVELEDLFVSKGFVLLERLSTLCVIPNKLKKVIAVNHFALPRNEIRSDLSGDTLLYVFRKK
jgi:2-polyprenyl-3-methyl-5-hydroxy-6-metoxy-1,4-benzoquinol methylase